MKPWDAEGLSNDDKYDIEEYATMMKNFGDAATEGNLEQVMMLNSVPVLNNYDPR